MEERGKGYSSGITVKANGYESETGAMSKSVDNNHTVLAIITFLSPAAEGYHKYSEPLFVIFSRRIMSALCGPDTKNRK